MDFSYLNSISDGDMDFVQQFISTFENNTANIVTNLKNAYEKDDSDGLQKLAHQLKPSLQMLEMQTLQTAIDIQDNGSSATMEQIEAIEKECLEAVVAMKKEYGL
ncbi:Hpt domain-containing protein [Marinoscillum sp.]|uniref:Hpt domain-containing protein n=1 Tax=Marinoscillum sp. TaxID=2024838 RepID=UPI003BA89C76